jgi:hypothetical protein
MNNTSMFQEQLRKAFQPTGSGVVGVVDHLLGLCGEEGLRLDWHLDGCRVRLLGGASHDSFEVPLRKSFFRAILARMAALCNQRVPGSVSPYGGAGELTVGTEQPTLFRVVFTNTPDEQRLEVRRAGSVLEQHSRLALAESEQPPHAAQEQIP